MRPSSRKRAKSTCSSTRTGAMSGVVTAAVAAPAPLHIVGSKTPGSRVLARVVGAAAPALVVVRPGGAENMTGESPALPKATLSLSTPGCSAAAATAAGSPPLRCARSWRRGASSSMAELLLSPAVRNHALCVLPAQQAWLGI